MNTTTRNRSQAIGNLTADPVLRATQKGRSVCNFIVATHETYRDPDGDSYEQHTEFHHCVAWGQLGENVYKRLRKGDLVSVAGPSRTRTNKTETTTYFNTTIEVREWDFLLRPAPRDEPSEEPEASDESEPAGPAT